MALKWIPSIAGLIKTGKPGGSTCVTASKCRQLEQARGANRDGDRSPVTALAMLVSEARNRSM
jgi:hypothetical protein